MEKFKYVDTVIGTVGDEQDSSFHGGGKTHPGACFPFGMVQLSPDTTTSGDNTTGYNYCQNTIEGFSFNHMSGVGWYGDLGNLQIMPITGETDLRSGSNAEVPFEKGNIGWKSHFSHNDEITKAGYYSVKLERYGIRAEATVSCRTGILRFTYPENAASGIIFNFSRRIAGHADFEEIKIDGKYIEGSIVCTPQGGGFGRGKGGIGYTLWFCLEVSKPFESARFFENETFLKDKLSLVKGEDLHLLVSFPTTKEEQVFIRCGISYTDAEGARKNLSNECPNFDFDGILSKAEIAWENALGCINIDAEENEKTLFYTCLYHVLLDPRTTVDFDGRYRTSDGEIKSADYNHRTMFSGWDVYRSQFPLLTLIDPQTVNDEVKTLSSIALEENSSFPRWELMGIDSKCMVGDPGLIVIADAYLKGIKDYNVEKVYDIAVTSAKSQLVWKGKRFNGLRPDCKQYRESAYEPYSLSGTLEFLLADFAMARFAEKLGKTDDYEYFIARALRYGENYNFDSGFMAARDERGEFVKIKDKYDCVGCVESNIYQQSFFVPYDVRGLSALFGRDRMIDLLEELFEKSDFGALWNENYNHSNEPCHNLTHYFDVLDKPERTQYWTRRVQKEAYRTGAFGFCGNEDVGQLSAWYVLSAVGFAQICMCDDKFYINTPLVRKAVLKLNKKYHDCAVSDTLTVICDKNPLEHDFIDAVIFNGCVLERNFLTYGELVSGGIIEFILK